jgi:predicted Zn-dependent peptidase
VASVRRFRYRGLRIIHLHHPGPLTAIAIAVRAGARFDGRHPGLAHLVEHMLFQGTQSLDQVALNRRAAELGGEHNADTGYEDISLTFEVFNADLDEALSLLAEQYYRTSIDPKRLHKEKRVVMEEIRGRLDDPADRLYRSAWARMFAGALAHGVAGTIASVRAIQPPAVRTFLRRQFQHASTAVAIVGGMTAEQVRASLSRHFRHGAPGAEANASPVRWGRGGSLRMRDSDGNQAYLLRLYAVSPDPRTILATGLALDLVGSDPDSHLFQELRERLGLSYEVGAHLEWGPDWAVAVISASGARSRAKRLESAVEGTCRRAATEGFAADDLARVRKKLRYRYAALADSRLDQAVALAQSVLWGVPTPAETERLVAQLSHEEVEGAWRRTLSGRSVAALLA